MAVRHRDVAPFAVLALALLVTGCGGKPSTSKQLRNAIEADLRRQEPAVKERGNLPHIGRCSGPGGPGTYYCRADDGQALTVHVDAQGRWSTTVRLLGVTHSKATISSKGEGLELRD